MARKKYRRTKPRRKKTSKYRKPRKRVHKKKGTFCNFCGKKIDSFLPFECRRCRELFCAEHRLPESHNCQGSGILKWAEEHKKFDKRPEYMEPPRRTEEWGKKRYKPETRMSFRLPISRRLTSKVSKMLFAVLVILTVEYFFFIDFFAITFYIFEAILVFFIILQLFRKADRMILSSDLQLFAARILSGVVFLIGIFLIYLAAGTTTFSIVFRVYDNPVTHAFSLFFALLGIGLMILSAFLIFRFKRGTGIIIWHGA